MLIGISTRGERNQSSSSNISAEGDRSPSSTSSSGRSMMSSTRSSSMRFAVSRNGVTLRRGGQVPISEQAFESWCYRNGGETYEERDGPGVACRFSGANVPDRVHYHPDTETVDVMAGGGFFSTRSIVQHADAWIDDDRLHVDVEDARVIVDPG